MVFDAFESVLAMAYAHAGSALSASETATSVHAARGPFKAKLLAALIARRMCDGRGFIYEIHVSGNFVDAAADITTSALDCYAIYKLLSCVIGFEEMGEKC